MYKYLEGIAFPSIEPQLSLFSTNMMGVCVNQLIRFTNGVLNALTFCQGGFFFLNINSMAHTVW